MKIEEARLEIYTKALGRKIHVTDLDVATFYSSKFDFAGPLPAQQRVEVELPDGTTRTLWVIPENERVELLQDRILVSSNLKFSETPPSLNERGKPSP